jgi:ribosomal protein S18 acetylase RimI-like enzyme
MDIIIRKAVIQDLPSIIKLASESITCSISPFRNMDVAKAIEYRKDDLQEIEKWLSPDSPGILLVAETDYGEFCGHVILVTGYFGLTGGPIGWILDITVCPSFRGSGLSQKLHEIVEIILMEKHIEGICLGVTSSNIRAVNFYKRLDYKEEFIQMVKLL